MQTSTQQSTRRREAQPEVIGPARLAALEKKPPATAPALLNEGQVAELLGVSRRQVHNLRDQDWFPSAIELGPRALRWYRDELLAAVAARAPRVTKKEEPQQLVEARAERRVYRDGLQITAVAPHGVAG